MINALKIALTFIIVSGVATGVAIWQGPDSFTFAWVLNMMLMAGVSYIMSLLNLSLNEAWFNTGSWETGGKIYNKLGVQGYRKLLVWTGWEKLNKPAAPVQNSVEAIKHLELAGRKSETGHLIIFIIVAVVNVYLALEYGLTGAGWLFVLNILLNVYPIWVQRHNRPRFRKVIRKMESSTYCSTH